MRIVSVRTLVLVPIWMAVASFAQDAHAGRYFYQEYYQPAVVIQNGTAYYAPTAVPYVPVAGPARGVVVQPVQGVVMQPGPAVVQSAPVAVQPAPGYVAPRKVVQRGLFWKTKAVVTGPPGHEEYQYHVHRFLAPNYHYTVRNDDGVVRTWGRRSW